jgi:hypothetical protein
VLAIFIKNRIYLLALTSIYFFLSFLNLINWGIYFDDLYLSALSPKELYDFFYQTGSPVTAYFHSFISNGFAPTPYRITQFVSGFVTAISVYFILEREVLKDRYWSFWATAIFVAVPINLVKVALTTMPSLICVAFFYLAFALMLCWKEKVSVRILAHLLFFISFIFNSLVILYVVFLLVLYTQSHDILKLPNSGDIRKFFKTYFDFLILPVLFISFKFLFFPKPQGAFVGYQAVNPSISLFSDSLLSFWTVLTGIFNGPTLTQYGIILITGLALSIFLYRTIRIVPKLEVLQGQSDLFKILLIATTAIFLAIFPYVLIGRSPIWYGTGWEDRDTLLLPFGFALLFLGTILFIISSEYFNESPKLKKFLGVCLPGLLFFSFAFLSIQGQIYFLREAIKQDAVIGFMKDEPQITQNFTFLVEDRSNQYNVFERLYISQYFNGFAYKVFGDQKRHFVIGKLLDEHEPLRHSSLNYDVEALARSTDLNTRIQAVNRDWKVDRIEQYLLIEKSEDAPLTFLRTLHLTGLKLLNRIQYENENKHTLVFKLQAVKGSEN